MKNESYTKIELKYCELCGGLWFRNEGTKEVYCMVCAPGMGEVSHGKKKPAASDPQYRRDLEGGTRCA